MAHSSRGGLGFYDDGRLKTAEAAERLEDLRVWAEKSPITRRRDLEPKLDEARGLLNRARARLEAVRMAGDDAARIRAARTAATAAVEELTDALTRLENRLPIAA
jgi:hypothetical protein